MVAINIDACSVGGWVCGRAGRSLSWWDYNVGCGGLGRNCYIKAKYNAPKFQSIYHYFHAFKLSIKFSYLNKIMKALNYGSNTMKLCVNVTS